MNTIKLISLNIRGNNFFSTVLPFLNNTLADIICLQDVYEKDILKLKEASKKQHHFFDSEGISVRDGMKESNGIAILSNRPLEDIQMHEYTNIGEDLSQHLLISAKIKVEDILYQVGTVHFTWSPDGKPNEKQRVDIQKLLKALDSYNEIVLCGDFNAPRGTEIFDLLATHYKDNIPKKVTTTIDGNLHRAGDLQYVVDGLFTTPEYNTKNVLVHCGVSDHCALIAEVSKNTQG